MKNKTLSDIDLKSQEKSKKRKKILIALLVLFVVIPLIAVSVTICGFAIWASTQKVDAELLPTASALPVYYDKDGNELPYSESNYVDIADVSDNLKNAFIALEDKRFYKHKGYDVVRMLGATVHNVKAGQIREGASTITQQLIKNTHLTNERTISRKLKELALAAQLEKQYSKDEILAMYLSVIYFGNGAYGIKQAADMYFGKNIGDLTLSECATLAGIVRNPAKYSPAKNPEESKTRRNVVLGVMYEQGYIDQSEYENAKAEPMQTATEHGYDNGGGLNAKACEFYILQAAKEVCGALGITKYQLSNSGLKIYTNLDSALQCELEKQRMNTQLRESEDIGNVSIVLNNISGAVLAYSSSYPYEISRQAGSVLKPLAVYAPALNENLISLATPVVDETIDFGGFSPKNYGGKYYGDTNVREAIKKSMNSVSVKVLDYLSVDKSVSYLNNLGIGTSESDKNYALALGATSKGVNPIAVAGGYMTIARGGEYVSPSFVRFVTDRGNKILSNENDSVSGTQSKRYALSLAASSLITSALLDTVKDGTAKTLSVLPFEVASKTGTVERSDSGNSDAWNASYNSQYTVLVWHGTDNIMKEKGGGYPTRHALKIWQTLAARNDMTKVFPMCNEIAEMEIDTYSTKCNKQVVLASENTPLEYRKKEYFSLDNIPTQSGSKFDSVSPAQLKITNNDGFVTISFDTESIYFYEVYRNDVTGSKLLYSDIGINDTVTLGDYPMAIEGKVDYTLICHLKDNEEISASDSKSVYIKDKILGRDYIF